MGGRPIGAMRPISTATMPTHAAPSLVSTSSPFGSLRRTTSGSYAQWRKATRFQCWVMMARRVIAGEGLVVAIPPNSAASAPPDDRRRCRQWSESDRELARRQIAGAVLDPLHDEFGHPLWIETLGELWRPPADRPVGQSRLGMGRSCVEDRDSAPSQLAVQGRRSRAQACLGCAVHRHVADRLLGDDAGQEDHEPAVQVGERHTHQIERTDQVGFDDLRELVARHAVERPERHDPGGVHEAVETSKASDRRVDGCGDGRVIGEIEVGGEGVAHGRSDRSGAVPVPTGDDEPCSSAVELDCEVGSEHARATRNDHHAIFEVPSAHGGGSAYRFHSDVPATLPSRAVQTVWVLGDQLNRRIGALGRATPATARVLLVESRAMLRGRRYHRQRLHFVLASMRRFARELEAKGFQVDYRRTSSLREGFEAHVAAYRPDEVVATEPNSRRVESLLRRSGIRLERSDQFLSHRDEFAAWAVGRRTLRLEDFYRNQRRRLGYLMDGDVPVGGRWNYDADNRKPPPAGGGTWPRPPRGRLDDVDRAVLAEIPEDAHGGPPVGWWATSRRGALARLRHFVAHGLRAFGPYEDAMTATNWHLAHSLLSPYLNLGLLLPGEVCDAVEAAYRSGSAPINSAEGVIRQIIGWREYIWGIYWLRPELNRSNVLEHTGALPPSWEGRAGTEMRCVDLALRGLEARGWLHHIQRLMVLANFANLCGVGPARVNTWMRERYIDGADWVMEPNVFGLGLWADGGSMSTKPYISGGAYIDRMSDYCKGCRFEPSKRSSEDACPFTTLYWHFLDRHRERLEGNPHLARQYATMDRLPDLPAVRTRGDAVLAAIAAGRL